MVAKPTAVKTGRSIWPTRTSPALSRRPSFTSRCQFFESNYSLIQPNTGGSGVAFFAHVGGFIFGFLIARVLVGTDRIAAQQA